MKFDLILFDLDGTLADTADDIAGAINLVLAEFDRPSVSRATVVSAIGGGVLRLIERVTAPPHQEVFQRFLAVYEENLLVQTRLYPGVPETLSRIPAKKIVLSNKPTGMCRTLLEKLDVAGYFQEIYGRDAFPARKPDPEVVRYVLSHVSGKSLLLVGDSGTDVQTAKAAGIPVAAVTYGYHHPGDLDGANHRIDRFEDLLPICEGSMP